MDAIWLIPACLVVGAAAFAAGRSSARRIDVDPSSSRRRQRSIFVERVEAPGSRPIRVCGRSRCRRPIVKTREGDEMVVRIEGEAILYFHGACAGKDGEPLP